MPSVSIIIAAYQVEGTVERCVHSALGQTLPDIEVIVVDDASTDGTASILARLADEDGRLTVITQPENRGLHLARKAGVALARGEWLVFLDGDDEFAPDFCERLLACVGTSDCDMVHFGITVVAEGELPERDRASFESYINKPSGEAHGLDIVRDIYDEACGYRTDWRTTQRLYRTDLAKRAFDAMTDERLERAEDSYETFVLAHLAQHAMGAEGVRGLIYHYGGGVTGASPITADRFAAFCRQFKACIDAARSYAAPHPELAASARGLERKALELLANDWDVRVPAGTAKQDAADAFASVFSPEIADREIYRFVRDRAWRHLDTGTYPESEDDPVFEEARIARSLFASCRREARGYGRCRRMRDTAEGHLHDLVEDRRLRDVRGQQRIRIFVSTHKKVDLFESNILQPVQVGSANAAERFAFMLHDDEADNISGKNPQYCELTTQYWAWKNVDADYYGFCHYRRYFDFSPERHKENAWGEVMDGHIDERAQRRYLLDDDSIAAAVEGYDVITTEFKDLRTFPGRASTPMAQYDAAPYLHEEDLLRVLSHMQDA